MPEYTFTVRVERTEFEMYEVTIDAESKKDAQLMIHEGSYDITHDNVVKSEWRNAEYTSEITRIENENPDSQEYYFQYTYPQEIVTYDDAIGVIPNDIEINFTKGKDNAFILFDDEKQSLHMQMVLYSLMKVSGRNALAYNRYNDEIKWSFSPKPFDVQYEWLWKKFGDIPIDDDEDIDIDFFIWPKGTDRVYIWHWFDNNYPGGLEALNGGSFQWTSSKDS